MPTTHTFTRLAAVAVLALGLIGCGQSARTTTAPAPTEPGATPPPPGGSPPVDEVSKERAKLTTDDRALVDAQEWCVISNEERLGAMGAPVKLTIKGQPVFVCCKGCARRAEADPDKTLATLAELKEKAKAEHAKTGKP
jgi:hypothetical protein